MKTIIVTGDSSGLGNKIAQELLENNYRVLGVSRRETNEVKKLAREYEFYKHYPFDLERTEGIDKFYDEVLKPEGPIYGLVYNSGMAYDDIITNAKLDQLEKMFRVNFFSAVILTKYVIRDMLLHETKGTIVYISSVSAHTGYKGLSMYAASKAALEAFSRTVAREWGERGIRSVCVAPGFMETAMTSVLTPEQKERIYRRTSLKTPVDVESVAKTVLFLLSDAARSITGTTIMIDCGTI